MAACLGDLVTLSLLGVVSTALIRYVNTPLPFILMVLVVICAVGCAFITRRNVYVRDLIKQGWTPLFGAMVISTSTGIILDHFVSQYKGYALLAVIIGGIILLSFERDITLRNQPCLGLPGGVGSVFISRLSTSLHVMKESLSLTPSNSGKVNPQPSIRLVTITFVLITLPIEIFFLATLKGLGWLQVPIIFILASVFFFCTAVRLA